MSTAIAIAKKVTNDDNDVIVYIWIDGKYGTLPRIVQITIRSRAPFQPVSVSSKRIPQQNNNNNDEDNNDNNSQPAAKSHRMGKTNKMR